MYSLKSIRESAVCWKISNIASMLIDGNFKQMGLISFLRRALEQTQHMMQKMNSTLLGNLKAKQTNHHTLGLTNGRNADRALTANSAL